MHFTMCSISVPSQSRHPLQLIPDVQHLAPFDFDHDPSIIAETTSMPLIIQKANTINHLQHEKGPHIF